MSSVPEPLANRKPDCSSPPLETTAETQTSEAEAGAGTRSSSGSEPSIGLSTGSVRNGSRSDSTGAEPLKADPSASPVPPTNSNSQPCDAQPPAAGEVPLKGTLLEPLLENSTPAPPSTFQPQADASGFFGSILSSVNNTFSDLSSQATNAVGDIQNTVLNLGTHATKLSTSLMAAEEQWREFFPIKARESEEEERLLNFFFCNLLTSIGHCAGTLFVSDVGLYFVSDQELEFNVDAEETDESQYRVSIPLNCVKGLAPRFSPKNETERYIHFVTADGFDFWFTGFLNYDSAFAHLLAALHDAGRRTDSLLRDEGS